MVEHDLVAGRCGKIFYLVDIARLARLCAEYEIIRPGAAVQGVYAAAADQPVVPQAAVNDVGAAIARQDVVRIVAGSAERCRT